MKLEKIYYFDHAATSWPKPQTVIQAVADALESGAANPGRGGHRMAVTAGRMIYETRQRLAQLLDIDNPLDISFHLNTSQALNLALHGYLKKGDHVISTSLEHNSVWRPLEYLKDHRGVEVDYVQANPEGQLDLDELVRRIKKNTVLLAVNHGSNLLGSIAPLGLIGKLARQHGLRLLVDAAQTAGNYPVSVKDCGIDMLAFPGHKGLLGPQGTGGLYVAPDLELEPLMHGGTGSQSERREQPAIRPDRYETGTVNVPGIAGLKAGVEWILGQTVEAIRRREEELIHYFMQGMSTLNRVRILGPGVNGERTGILSFVSETTDAAEIAFRLDREYRIAVRAGYHCSPLAHHSAGTHATGAVRASIGHGTTREEIDYFMESLEHILASNG